jgi:hypothetical protein
LLLRVRATNRREFGRGFCLGAAEKRAGSWRPKDQKKPTVKLLANGRTVAASGEKKPATGIDNLGQFKR